MQADRLQQATLFGHIIHYGLTVLPQSKLETLNKLNEHTEEVTEQTHDQELLKYSIYMELFICSSYTKTTMVCHPLNESICSVFTFAYKLQYTDMHSNP